MDSQEKKNKRSGMTDELDLEPLDLDFDLELPSLDDESLSDTEFALPEIPEIAEAPDVESQIGVQEADGLPEPDDEGPITLTADELNDIVSADLMGGSGESTEPIEMGAGLSTPEEPGEENLGELEVPEFDDAELAFPSTSEPFGEGEFATEELDLEPGSLEDQILDLPLPEEALEAGETGGLSGSGFDIDIPPEPIDIDLEFEQEGEQPFETSPGLSELSSFGGESVEDLSFASPQGETAESEDLVSLSEEELDSILGDVDEGVEESEEETADELEAAEVGLEEAPLPEIPEAEEGSVFGVEETPSILDAEEDESITLTADELSNIVSGGVQPPEEEPELSGAGMPISEAVPSSEISFFHDEGEEGPVALTDSELAEIMEGTTVEEELPAPRTERMADELSMETGLKRDELKRIIGYLDDLLGQLPEDTVREFSRSEYFSLYKKVIEDLEIYR